jgi:hypothetical protein
MHAHANNFSFKVIVLYCHIEDLDMYMHYLKSQSSIILYMEVIQLSLLLFKILAHLFSNMIL